LILARIGAAWSGRSVFPRRDEPTSELTFDEADSSREVLQRDRFFIDLEPRCVRDDARELLRVWGSPVERDEEVEH
jgi:hypothetical protein